MFRWIKKQPEEEEDNHDHEQEECMEGGGAWGRGREEEDEEENEDNMHACKNVIMNFTTLKRAKGWIWWSAVGDRIYFFSTCK